MRLLLSLTANLFGVGTSFRKYTPLDGKAAPSLNVGGCSLRVWHARTTRVISTKKKTRMLRDKPTWRRVLVQRKRAAQFVVASYGEGKAFESGTFDKEPYGKISPVQVGHHVKEEMPSLGLGRPARDHSRTTHPLG
jgi:hypothetical protein